MGKWTMKELQHWWTCTITHVYRLQLCQEMESNGFNDRIVILAQRAREFYESGKPLTKEMLSSLRGFDR